MRLAIVGAGLVTPLGITPLQHAAFLRAGLGVASPSGFEHEGEPVPARHCAWLGAKMPLLQRLVALARRALSSALEGRSVESLWLVLPSPRWSFENADRARVAETLASMTGVKVTVCKDTAEAIEQAEAELARGAALTALLAVDSFVTLDDVDASLDRNPWDAEHPPPGEGAAAWIVGRATKNALASLDYASALRGPDTEDEEGIVDGAPMTDLVRTLPRGGSSIVRSYGQAELDRFRRNEWTYAVARNRARFDMRLGERCLETFAGTLGAASLLASAVYGVACEHHFASREHHAGSGPFVAWAVHDDGTRSLAMLSLGAQP